MIDGSRGATLDSARRRVARDVPARLKRKMVDQMADAALKPGDFVTGRVTRVQPMLAQVVAQEQRGVIYGGSAGKLTVGQHVRVRILEVNGSNGYKFTGSLLS